LEEISTAIFLLTVHKPENQNCHRDYDNAAQYGKKPDLLLVGREVFFNSLFSVKAHGSKQTNDFF
jgi:hypothetical protein